MPPEVGGPPERNATFQWLDRPPGISFSNGRAETTGTTETTGKWQCHASAPGNRPARSPRAYSMREALSRHNPGGLGGPGGPGSRRWSREAAMCLPGPLPMCLPSPLPCACMVNVQRTRCGRCTRPAPCAECRSSGCSSRPRAPAGSRTSQDASARRAASPARRR